MPFESSIRPDLPAGFTTPLLAVVVSQGALPPSLAALDQGTGGALARLQEITPAGMLPQIDLTLTDEFPLAQAIVIISANPPA